jgi:hypothetical protein
MVGKSMVGSSELAHILAKTRDAAAHGPGALSTGEALAAALVLNRPDWLIAMKYTLAEAIGRIGPEWAALIPAAANEFKQESDAAEYEAAMKDQRARLAQFSRSREAEDAVLEFAAKFVTAGSAPGYRDVYLTLDLEPTGVEPRHTMRARIALRPQDGEEVAREIADVHRFAWRRGNPIDAAPGEARPRWLGELNAGGATGGRSHE